MKKNNYEIRNENPEEFDKVRKLMVNVYSQLSGFPDIMEQAD